MAEAIPAAQSWQRLLYRILWHPVTCLFFLLFSYRSVGRRTVPRNGGLLIVANHQSYLDPPLVGSAVYRPLVYLAKKSLFRHRLLGGLIRLLGATPINIDASGTEGIKVSLAQLQAGQPVLVFPEGSRTPDGLMHDFKPGVVVLIRRGKVPVLPVGVAGAYDAWPSHAKRPRFAPIFLPAEKATITVVIGEPIPFEELKDLQPAAMLARLEREVAVLQERAERLRRR